MKRIALKVLLLALLVVEIYLCSALLPTGWQAAILQWWYHILPKTFDYSVVTHPAVDYEIRDVLQKNVGLRVAGYVVFILLLAGNTFLVSKIWRVLRLQSQTK